MEDFIKISFPEIADVYFNYKYDVQRWDVIRYLILYKMGGCMLILITNVLSLLMIILIITENAFLQWSRSNIAKDSRTVYISIMH